MLVDSLGAKRRGGKKHKPVGGGGNPSYASAYRIEQRTAQKVPELEPLRVPEPLNQLPWSRERPVRGASL